jgi:F0F1-type ATP synthase delta subunit
MENVTKIKKMINKIIETIKHQLIKIRNLNNPSMDDKCREETLDAVVGGIVEDSFNEFVETSKINRVEIITQRGRQLVRYFDPNKVKVTVSFQDKNHTLKLFITDVL